MAGEKVDAILFFLSVHSYCLRLQLALLASHKSLSQPTRGLIAY